MLHSRHQPLPCSIRWYPKNPDADPQLQEARQSYPSVSAARQALQRWQQAKSARALLHNPQTWDAEILPLAQTIQNPAN
ncbi:hypothetical protein OH491_24390 [Termitidicoccus mucosus]|uniref:Uncharacterized protein n=1 Tax=Termitidicoccus mucosus TaxID=1184151 RepID=A0A178IQC9_9BACT|nr:hypothetical protein AW736_02065 [Opitutaceae bacterium TSB47]